MDLIPRRVLPNQRLCCFFFPIAEHEDHKDILLGDSLQHYDALLHKKQCRMLLTAVH